MERRYYLLKIGLIALAVITAVVTGGVGSTAYAQSIATEMGKNACVKDAKIAKITQQIGSYRQKYVLELDVRCGDDNAKKKSDKPAEEGGKEVAP